MSDPVAELQAVCRHDADKGYNSHGTFICLWCDKPLCPNGVHCADGRHEFEHQRDEESHGKSWLGCAACDCYMADDKIMCLATGRIA